MVLGNSQEDIYQSKRHFLICFEDSDLNCIYHEKKNLLPSILKNKMYHVKNEITKITLVLFVLYFLKLMMMNEPPILNTKPFLTQNTYTYTLT